MTDHPILFSAPMVRALLAGTKTQTRRVLKGAALAAHEPEWEAKRGAGGIWWLVADTPAVSGNIVPVLRFAPGDRLYVREAFCAGRPAIPSGIGIMPERGEIEPGCKVVYAADWGDFDPPPWRPSIHMPRWASRLTLRVTEVRVQRLQEISEEDAVAEGIESILRPDGTGIGVHVVIAEKVIGGWVLPRNRDVYETLWEHINGAGAWDANPWVTATTFTVEKVNIDAAVGTGSNPERAVAREGGSRLAERLDAGTVGPGGQRAGANNA